MAPILLGETRPAVMPENSKGGVMRKTCGVRLGVVLLAGVAVLAGCGGKSGSSTEASSSSQTLKRLEVHVARGASAEAPHRSMLARAADLLGDGGGPIRDHGCQR
jgi:hypothetical protein